MFGQFRSYMWRRLHASRDRKAGRTQLKAAKRGDREQFLALAAGYIDLAYDYFGTTLAEGDVRRASRVEQIFLALWQQLGYAERLSDFEYMLATLLVESTPADATITSQSPIVTKMRLLAPQVRFAFLAYELENWPLRWVALVMRVRTGALHRLVAEARCELCGVSWESLTTAERACLEAISTALDQQPNHRANKVLQKRTRSYPRIAAIKAQWLELRPELVEVRLRYKPGQQEREKFLKGLFDKTLEMPMQRPAMVDRMVNTVHFSRHNNIKIS
jgi:hypothetical protein